MGGFSAAALFGCFFLSFFIFNFFNQVMDPKVSRIPVKAPRSKSNWLWCSQCRRAFRYGEYRLVGVLQLCPNADCAADTAKFAWPWEELLADNPGYPEVPRRDTRYGK